MTYFVVDVEADGTCPGLYSMVSFGAVKLDKDLKTTFYGETAPISDKWVPQALAVSNITREQHLDYPAPQITIPKFYDWVKANSDGRSVLISDNNGFDAMFITYYMALCELDNPFGFSSRRIGDIYSGIRRDIFAASKWKNLRKTKHDHNPVNDCLGNAEALISMLTTAGMKIPV